MTGKVDPTKLPVLANWTRNNSLETVLVEIRRSATPVRPPRLLNSNNTLREMASFNNRKLPQPPEGSMF